MREHQIYELFYKLGEEAAVSQFHSSGSEPPKLVPTVAKALVSLPQVSAVTDRLISRISGASSTPTNKSNAPSISFTLPTGYIPPSAVGLIDRGGMPHSPTVKGLSLTWGF